MDENGRKMNNCIKTNESNESNENILRLLEDFAVKSFKFDLGNLMKFYLEIYMKRKVRVTYCATSCGKVESERI